jgi:hypothetical protein
MGWAAVESSLRLHIPGAADGLRFERNLHGRDHTYAYAHAECDPNSNASADTDPVPHTDAHAVPVAKPIAKPNAYAVRDFLKKAYRCSSERGTLADLECACALRGCQAVVCQLSLAASRLIQGGKVRRRYLASEIA